MIEEGGSIGGGNGCCNRRRTSPHSLGLYDMTHLVDGGNGSIYTANYRGKPVIVKVSLW